MEERIFVIEGWNNPPMTFRHFSGGSTVADHVFVYIQKIGEAPADQPFKSRGEVYRFLAALEEKGVRTRISNRYPG